MATRWPTEILKLGMPPRNTWGRVYNVREEGEIVDDFLSSRREITAQADIRGGSAEVGEMLTDSQGRMWTVTEVAPSSSYYGGGVTLDLQMNVQGVGD